MQQTVMGAYESCPLNPIISHCNRIGQGNQIQGVGHADLIQAEDGSWWTVCLSFRVTQPYSYYHILGRETFLVPVDWPKGGWPQVNGNSIISLEMNVPTLPVQTVEIEPTRTDFDKESLDFKWQYLRNPIWDNYSLTGKRSSENSSIAIYPQ